MISSNSIQAHIHKRDFSEAESMIKTWLEMDPENPEPIYLRGVSEYLQGKVGPAIESLKKVLAIDPKHTDAAVCLSVLYNDLGKYDEAKNTFQLANQSVAQRKDMSQRPGTLSSTIDQKFSIKHLELADMYFRYRRYDEAIEEYTRAIMLDPRSNEAKIRRAKAYARKGFISRAHQDLLALKNEEPDYIAVRIQLGLLYFSQKNLVDAELEWEEVLQLEPKNVEAKAYLEMCKKTRLHEF